MFSSLPLPATAKHVPLSLLCPFHHVESSSAKAQIWWHPAMAMNRVSKESSSPEPGERPKQTSQGELKWN